VQRSRIALGALMVAVMAAAIALIPAMMFPVIKEHNEALALGYVVTRTVEVVLLLPAAIGPLVLLAVSSEHSTDVQNVQFETLRTLLLTYDEWGPALMRCSSA
jgi:acetaldehyde dehydrogenase (acetylating)